MRGGRRSTSYTPTWRHGKTRTIRVPIVLADQILALAKDLDNDVTQIKSEDSSILDKSALIIATVDQYINSKLTQSRGNQYKRKGEVVDIEKSRDWKHLLRFKKLIEESHE